MNKRFLTALVFVVFAMGCVAMMNMEDREQVYGKSTPAITASFASKELRPGDTWKIYLRAFDPDGDMKYIVATIDQAGMGAYSASFTRIKEGNRKEMSGYVYLNTGSGAGYTSRIFYDLTLTIQIQDKAGHYSKPVVIPLMFQFRASAQETPPPGDFKGQDLGPIMIELRTMTAENNRGGRKIF